MSFKKLATSTAMIAGLVAANLSPLAVTAASAHDGWRGKGGHHSYSRHYDNRRHYHGHRKHRHYGYRKHRHDHGKDLAKGLAIGLGVLAVGAIISHAHR